MARTQRNLFAAVVLFFTAPLVAEFLLGDLTINLLSALVALAPMYGGGALLIREVVRRSGRGWPAILLLGCAYTIVEEAFVTQSLFNPDYLRLHMHFLSHGWIPALHIGVWWTLFMFNLHTFWSISVSIALVEALFPAQAEQPWLGRLGDSVTAVLFLFGCAACIFFTLHQDPFVATSVQFIVAGVACLAFIARAFSTKTRSPRTAVGSVPPPVVTGIAAFLLGFGVLMIPSAWNWGAFAAMLSIDVIFLIALSALSRRAAWTPLHVLSLAAGGAFAYGIHAFIQKPVSGGSTLLVRSGNAVFLAAAISVVLIAALRTSRSLRAGAAQTAPAS